MPDLIVFDCDGVLIDSEIIAARVESELLGEMGIAVTPAEVTARYSGLSNASMGTVTISVSGMNDAPTGIDDSGAGFSTDEDTTGVS